MQEKVADIMLKISINTNFDNFRLEVEARIFPGSRVVAIIDAPTSRSSTLYALIDKCVGLLSKPQQWRLWVPLLQRFELLGQLQTNLQEKFPNRFPYVVTAHGQDRNTHDINTQRSHNQPSFGIVVSAKNERVATFVSKTGSSAKTHEHLRAVCADPKCKFRGDSNTEAPASEVHHHDNAVASQQLFFEELGGVQFLRPYFNYFLNPTGGLPLNLL